MRVSVDLLEDRSLRCLASRHGMGRFEGAGWKRGGSIEKKVGRCSASDEHHN